VTETTPTPDPPGNDVMAGTRAVLRKVGLGVLVLSVVAVLVFWLGWVRAPSPEQICKHKIELVIDQVGEDQTEGADALVGQLEAKCVESAERKIKLRGKIVYADYAKCVMASTSLMDAERC
jgi:hypothetical protein